MVDAEILTTSLSRQATQHFVERFSRLSIQEKGSEIYLRSFFNLENIRKKRLEIEDSVQVPNLGAFVGTPGSKINLIVKVPSGLTLEIYDNSGEVYIHDLLNNLRMDDDAGRLTVHNIRGDVRIQDGSGRLAVKGITGKVRIYDKSGKITVEEVSDSLTIRDRSGAITIRQVQGPLRVSDRSGAITIIRPKLKYGLMTVPAVSYSSTRWLTRRLLHKSEFTTGRAIYTSKMYPRKPK
ncbi:MAG: DUF4097 family beta strand repeat protein [Bacteroidia bacterium]|nr:DUF4097 family beta strand repeat protein [Bacteroidia bacterium]